jgi:hypothetical protein
MKPENKTWIILAAITSAELTPLVWLAKPNVSHFLHALGFGGSHPGTPLGWALALLFAAVFAGATASRSPFIREHLLQLTLMKLFVLLVMAPVTGAFEEFYFRRVLMDTLAHHGSNIGLQILASAVVFGLVHGIWGLFSRTFRVAAGAIVATTLLGLLMAIVYIAAGRSVGPCIVSHALINAVLEPGLILAAVSGAWRGLHAQSA